jgi:hypothetical protein
VYFVAFFPLDGDLIDKDHRDTFFRRLSGKCQADSGNPETCRFGQTAGEY